MPLRVPRAPGWATAPASSSSTMAGAAPPRRAGALREPLVLAAPGRALPGPDGERRVTAAICPVRALLAAALRTLEAWRRGVPAFAAPACTPTEMLATRTSAPS